MKYAATVLALIAINAIAATGLNLVVAFCGVSLAASAYFAVGAYAYALATLTLGLDFMSATLFAVAVAAALSPAISVPAWRLRGDAFMLTTLTLQAFAYAVCYNWYSEHSDVGTLANLTNGAYGIRNIPGPSFFGVSLDDSRAVSLLFVAIAVALLLSVRRALNSPWGRTLAAMRDDELLSRSLGKNTRLLKVQVAAIACGCAGLAGACYAAMLTYLDPQIALVDSSIVLLVMVLIGGTGNVVGPVVGAALFFLLPEALTFARIPLDNAPAVRLLIFGLLLLVTVHIRPRGLAGRYSID